MTIQKLTRQIAATVDRTNLAAIDAPRKTIQEVARTICSSLGQLDEQLGAKLGHLAISGAVARASVPSTHIVDLGGYKMDWVGLTVTNGKLNFRIAKDVNRFYKDFNSTAAGQAELERYVEKNGPAAVENAFENVLQKFLDELKKLQQEGERAP